MVGLARASVKAYSKSNRARLRHGEILARLNEMGRGDIRRENKIDNLQREMSKLKKENGELREENRLMRDAAKGQLTRMEWLEREIRKRNVVLQGVEEEKNENEKHPSWLK